MRQLLDTATSLFEITQEKRYWMIRTDDGVNYLPFKENGFVALKFKDTSIDFLDEVDEYETPADRLEHIRMVVQNRQSLHYTVNEDTPINKIVGQRASQIYKFVYEITAGDIVMIPSKNSATISIGKVLDEGLCTDCNIKQNFSFARRVQWINHIPKRKLDPCLYKAIGAHQALCEVTEHREFIERNYNSIFASDEAFNFVITINSEKVNAVAFSEYLSKMMTCCKKLDEENLLGLDFETLNVSTFLNSPGKLSFKGSVKTVVMLTALSIAVFGGRFKYNDIELETNGAFTPLINAINEYRRITNENDSLLNTIRQSTEILNVKSVEEWNDTLEEAEE